MGLRSNAKTPRPHRQRQLPRKKFAYWRREICRVCVSGDIVEPVGGLGDKTTKGLLHEFLELEDKSTIPTLSVVGWWEPTFPFNEADARRCLLQRRTTKRLYFWAARP
jgi:hypothetical protein